MYSGSLKDSLKGLKSKLESLQSLIDTEPEQVKEEKVKFRRFENSEEKINQLLDSKIIRLNIGGKIFYTKESTLSYFQDSLFCKALQSDQNQNELFFDRPSNNFYVILDILRNKKLSLKKLNKFVLEEIKDELNFYKIDPEEFIPSRVDYDLEWDMTLSKEAACSINNNDPKSLRVNSTTCYTHFVTNKVWTEENFIVEFELNVQQTDDYFYIGLVNDGYIYSSNCMCCGPQNAFYLQCNGTFRCNSQATTDDQFAFRSAPTTIGMKVNLQEKTLSFYIPDKAEYGPMKLTGDNFRIVSGHCNTGNGFINILSCYEN